MQGDLVGAEPLLERGLALRGETLGVNHPATARALIAVGKLRADQGRFLESQELIQTASHQLQSLLGPRHLDFVASLDELAWIYLKGAGNMPRPELPSSSRSGPSIPTAKSVRPAG